MKLYNFDEFINENYKDILKNHNDNIQRQNKLHNIIETEWMGNCISDDNNIIWVKDFNENNISGITLNYNTFHNIEDHNCTWNRLFLKDDDVTIIPYKNNNFKKGTQNFYKKHFDVNNILRYLIMLDNDTEVLVEKNRGFNYYYINPKKNNLWIRIMYMKNVDFDGYKVTQYIIDYTNDNVWDNIYETTKETTLKDFKDLKKMKELVLRLF